MECGPRNEAKLTYSCSQESKKLLELCNKGGFEEVTSLLKSKDKGAAVNATFKDVLVCGVRVHVVYSVMYVCYGLCRRESPP